MVSLTNGGYMRSKNWILILILVLLSVSSLLIVKQNTIHMVKAGSRDDLSGSPNCPTPTATETQSPPPTPAPLTIAQLTPTPSSTPFNPCSYLPIIQHQNDRTVCPTATPEASQTIPPYPTPVPLQAMGQPCVTATPWPVPTIGTPPP